MASTSVALLVDFENLIRGLPRGVDEEDPFDINILLRLVEEEGRAVVARAYADWRDRQLNAYQSELYKNGLDLIHVLGRGMKNAVDVRMAVDAMELLYERPKIRTYVLVSGDRDFIHLLKKLREHGCKIIGVAPEQSASDDLAELCDRFVTYQALVASYRVGGGPSESPVVSADRLEVFKAQLSEIVKDVGADGMLGARLKLLIRRNIGPAFDESDFGYNKLIDLMRSIPDVVTVVRPEGEGDFKVYPAGEYSLSAADVIPQARARLESLHIDWARPQRDAILKALHGEMGDKSFTQAELIVRMERHELDGGHLSDRKVNGYIKVCYQSRMFRFTGNHDAPPQEREMMLLPVYQELEVFISRFEQSILYKVKDLLPDARAEQIECARILLELLPEDDGYVDELLGRIQ